MKEPRNPYRWTNREIEVDSDGYVAAQQAYREDQEATEQQRQDADDRERYKQAFVEAGGRERDAEAAHKAHRNQQAAEAAARSNTEALEASRRRIRQAL